MESNNTFVLLVQANCNLLYSLRKIYIQILNMQTACITTRIDCIMHAHVVTPDNFNNCSHLFYQKFHQRFVYASIHAKL